MKMAEFIEDNRDELETCIRNVWKNAGKLSKSDIKEWIMNDEGLYRWAKSEGVKV